MNEPELPSPLSDPLDAKREARLREADHVWATFAGAGFKDGMVALLDFVLYGRDEQAATALREQVQATYRVTVTPLEGTGWMVTGTTRPFGSRLTAASHKDWVRFMCELGRPHGYVFSAWIVESPELEIRVSSAAFEATAGDA
jgi:hypothetical protein